MSKRKPELVPLDDRILFDVAPIDVHSVEPQAIDFAPGTNAEYDWASSDPELVNEHWISADYSSIEQEQTTELSELSSLLDTEVHSQEALDANTEYKQLIVVDRSVDDFLGLIDLAIGEQDPGDYELLLVDSNESALERINERFESTRYSAVHFVAHGQDGEIRLGNETWNSDFLEQESSQFSLWQSALSDDADLQIYGCNVAETDIGKDFVQQLAETTGTDVAASDDTTGVEHLGGDWELEYVIGEVSETSDFFDVQQVQHWDGTLNVAPIITATTEGINGGTSHDAIAMDQFGNFVVTWSVDDGDSGVFAQVINADGTERTAIFQVNETIAGDQEFASVASDEDGNFVIVWTDSNLNKVFAKSYFADGSVNQGEFLVADDAVGASVAMNQSGQWVVAWDSSTDGRIKAEIYNTDGSVRVSEFTANDNGGSGSRQNVSVDMNATGDIAIVWDKSEFSNDIYLAKYDIDGVDQLGGEIKVADILFNELSQADVSMNDSGEIAVSLTRQNLGGIDVGVHMVNSDGSLGNIYTPVNVTSDGSQFNSSIAMDDNGDFVVMWEGNGVGDDEGIFYRVYDAALDQFGNEIRVNDYTTGEQHSASLQLRNKNEMLIAFSGEGPSGPTIFVDYTLNRAPTDIEFDNLSIDENSADGILVGTATTHDLDPSETFTYSMNNDAGGRFTIDSDGQLLVADQTLLNFEDNETHLIEVEVEDSKGATFTKQFTVNVDNVNETPIATDDHLVATEDTPFTFTLASILGNDSDTDGDLVELDSFTQPINGTLTDNGNGTFTYLPFDDFDQNDSFQYIIKDAGGLSATGNVTINVTPVNDRPEAVDDVFGLDEGETLVVTDSVFLNDVDVDGDILNSGTLVSGPAHGTLSWNNDGTFTYTHDGSENHTDQFTYQVTDGNGEFSTATVTLNIDPPNAPPVANGETVQIESPGGTVITKQDFLANDLDPDGDKLRIVIVQQPEHGTLELVDGKLVYTPDPGFDGMDTIQYRVRDGELRSNIATMTLDVNFTPMVANRETPQSFDTSSESEQETTDPVEDEAPQERESESGETDNNPEITLSVGTGVGQSETEDEDNEARGAVLALIDQDEEFSLRTGSSDSSEERYKFSSDTRTVSFRTSEFENSSRYRSVVEKQFETTTYSIEESDYSSEFAFANMSRELDMFDHDFKVEGAVDQVTFATLSSITGVLTVGYVLWMVRGGMLMASFVSSIPAWQSVDPLNIVEFGSLGSADGDDESLESIVDQFTTNV